MTTKISRRFLPKSLLKKKPNEMPRKLNQMEAKRKLEIRREERKEARKARRVAKRETTSRAMSCD